MMFDYNTQEREELKFERMRKGIKLKEIADYVDCHLSLISKYENNKVDLNLEMKKRYEEYIRSK